MESEKSTVKAFPISYELNLISAGEEIIFWGNDLRMKSKIKGTDKYKQLLDLNDWRMAATKENGEIDIFNLYTREIEFTLIGHTKNIVAICTIDTGNINEHIIATAAYDHTIRIWNILNKECISVIKCSGYISVLIYDPRTGYLLNSADGIVTIRNYKTLEIIREIDHGRVKIYQLLQINEEQIISVCNFAKLSLRIWNIENGETIKDIYIPNSMGFVCGVLLDKNILLLGEADTGRVYTYDLMAYTVINTYKIHQTGGNITQICILNKKEAISCSKDNVIKLFDIKTGIIKITLNEHQSEVNSILPVLFPLNAQFENNSLIPKEYIIDIFIKFHDENLFMTDKMNFCKRTSLSFWDGIHEEYENNQRYYLISNKQIIILESQINSKKCIKEGYESIKRYLKGEEIVINTSNYSYLLSFAYSEKILKLREICEEVHKNIFFKERIEKQYFLSHFDSNIIY